MKSFQAPLKSLPPKAPRHYGDESIKSQVAIGLLITDSGEFDYGVFAAMEFRQQIVIFRKFGASLDQDRLLSIMNDSFWFWYWDPKSKK